jgi:hypothetical protein
MPEKLPVTMKLSKKFGSIQKAERLLGTISTFNQRIYLLITRSSTEDEYHMVGSSGK